VSRTGVFANSLFAWDESKPLVSRIVHFFSAPCVMRSVVPFYLYFSQTHRIPLGPSNRGRRVV
jgi:hypothetical protein